MLLCYLFTPPPHSFFWLFRYLNNKYSEVRRRAGQLRITVGAKPARTVLHYACTHNLSRRCQMV